MGRAKSMYAWFCKNYRCVVPCTCCSRSQQRSSPGLRLRLTAPLVLIERVWWISHYLITPYSALDIWQSTFHTPVVEEVAGPRDICQAVLIAIFPSGVLQQLFECLPQSLREITYWTKTWIQSVWVPKTMPGRKHNKLKRNDTAGSVAAALAVASCIFIFMKRLFCVRRRSVLFLGSWLKLKYS